MLSSAKHWSEAVGYSMQDFSKEDLIELYYYVQKEMLKIYRKHDLLLEKEFREKLDLFTKDKELYESLREKT